MEQEKSQKEKECVSLDVELEKVNDSFSKLTKEKLSLEDKLNEVTNSLQTEEDKASRLGKIKTKLEASLQEAQDEIEKEKKTSNDLDKAKRKLEGELKVKEKRKKREAKRREERWWGLNFEGKKFIFSVTPQSTAEATLKVILVCTWCHCVFYFGRESCLVTNRVKKGKHQNKREIYCT